MNGDAGTTVGTPTGLSDQPQPANHSLSGSVAASDERSPVSRIAVAADAIALAATQVKPPPTLTRCAPAATISASDSPGSASTLTGFATAWHTAQISSALWRPGA